MRAWRMRELPGDIRSAKSSAPDVRLGRLVAYLELVLVYCNCGVYRLFKFRSAGDISNPSKLFRAICDTDSLGNREIFFF